MYPLYLKLMLKNLITAFAQSSRKKKLVACWESTILNMIQILHKTLQLQVSLKDFAAQFPIKRFILVPRYNQLIEIYIIVSLNNRPFLNRVQNELSLK